MVNPEFIKYVPEKVCLENILKWSNPKVIFKRVKMVFLRNDGCKKSFVGMLGETAKSNCRKAQPINGLGQILPTPNIFQPAPNTI